MPPDPHHGPLDLGPPPAEAAEHPSPAGPTLAQLQAMPRDELLALAGDYGLHPHDYATPQHVAVALHRRLQCIAAMDRQAMLDVIRWGRRPVPVNATRDQLAREIVAIQSMRFAGLSHRGLVVLALMRGIEATADMPDAELVRLLKKQEGLLAKIARKRRALLASLVSGLIGEDRSADYQFLPPQQESHSPAGSAASLRDEIEEAGLIGGITGRLKRTADAYLHQKMDEIEARIDRKLDEIDRRLAEWRDKEVANRIRILKITLWASVIVSLIALLYTYIKVHFFPS